ncbi:hypothetical protein M0R45_035015 [Rubus argutus]|uniref:Retrotransposon gag domain-containing protein n=1 Tax=Rubus argutus TaxID=59490 RepID=A0AAW1VWA1_RUBAR
MSWFFELKPHSINSFQALVNAFGSRFILMTDGYHTTGQLFKLRQGEGESLKSFVTQWRTATLRCRDLDKNQAYTAFKEGLTRGHFLYELNAHPPTDYEALMETAVLHAQAEYTTYGDLPPTHREARQGTANAQPSPTKKRKDWHREPVPQKRQRENNYGRQHDSTDRSRQRENRPRDNPHRLTAQAPRYEVFTVLTAPLEDIFDQCRDQIPPPPPKRFLRTNPPRNTGKWCKHHEGNGHNTNVCVALKTAVETLIREGKLQQFGADPAQPQVANIQVIRSHINIIDGGAPVSRLTNRARKRHTRAQQGQKIFSIYYDKPSKANKVGWEPITFTEEEERGVRLPHDDPFLITAQVDHYTLSRVLIDSGSAVNVIFNQAYAQLGRKGNKLLQDNEPLLSFSGDITQPLGSDYMRLILGSNPRCAEINTEFIVVDCLSSYNAILGRPALNKLKCIIAGHMLLMQFPTPAGTASIRGNQQIARKCYTTILIRGRARSEILSVVSPPKPSDMPQDPRDNLSSLDSPDPRSCSPQFISRS